jgi:hypothetical protein
MTLTLEIPRDLEEPLTRAALQQGVPLENYALELMQRAMQRQRNQASIAVLQSFMSEEEDGSEHAETWQTLKQGLADSRRRTQKEQ